ncbi:MAG: endolytic transglycosylase MltG [Christensenellales bacterium]|jgi:UPF0755 protein
MPRRNTRPNAYRPERYNTRTLHKEREYGFYWYEWLWKALRPVLVFLCSLLIVVGLITSVWNRVDESFLKPVEPGNLETVVFEITDGQTITSIGNELVKAELLRNASVFKYIVQFKGLTSAISYGSYNLSKGMDVNEIISEISSGSQTNERTITIVPGWTIEDVADYLVDQDAITSRDEFLALCNQPERFTNYSYALSAAYDAGVLEGRKYALEGYLAPDTYRVFKSADSESILRTLLSQGNTVVDRVFYSDHTQYTIDAEGIYTQVEQYRSELTMDQVIILASMIEKEAGKVEDFAKVSAVFYNRLSEDWRLDSDATINYLTGRNALVLTGEELAIQSAYNTYYISGLPAGAICNPSEAALFAALYPEMAFINEGYMYFCSKEPTSGELAFAKTAEEHQANVAMYRPSWEAYDALNE